MRFTPGPWHKFIQNRMSSDYKIIIKAGSLSIAELSNNDVAGQSNANLIAASPDLLEACNAAFRALADKTGQEAALVLIINAVTKAMRGSI